VAANAGARARHERVWQPTLEREPAEKVCGSKRWSAQPLKRWGGSERQSARPLRKCEVADAVAGNRVTKPMPVLWHATVRCRWRRWRRWRRW